MNKLLALVAAATLSLPLMAEEPAQAEAANEPQAAAAEARPMRNTWPAFFAVAQVPRATDVMGLRLTIPFSTVQENVTGVDLGFWGRALYFEGFQLNVLRNDAVDSCAGVQVGIYNSIGRGELFGVQVGLWNEAMSLRGLQAGIVNTVGEGQGLMVGVINRAETFYGYQVGLINIIRDAELQFLPIINVGF